MVTTDELRKNTLLIPLRCKTAGPRICMRKNGKTNYKRKSSCVETIVY